LNARMGCEYVYAHSSSRSPALSPTWKTVKESSLTETSTSCPRSTSKPASLSRRDGSTDAGSVAPAPSVGCPVGDEGESRSGGFGEEGEDGGEEGDGEEAGRKYEAVQAGRTLRAVETTWAAARAWMWRMLLLAELRIVSPGQLIAAAGSRSTTCGCRPAGSFWVQMS
jgi:hypothetical protein